MVLVFIVAALCVVIDQLTKYLIEASFAVGESVELIDGIFRFTYIKNEGAAFGSLADARWIFMSVSVILIIGIILYTVWKRPKSKLLCLSLGLIMGGGIGNMIDRTMLGYVVDFLDFCAFPQLWKWIFNFADVFVCVGVGLLVLWMLVFDGKEKKDDGGEDGASVTEAVTDDGKGGNENDEAE